MKFGCVFNPRPTPGRCIKDTNSINIDKQCEATETSCKLISQPDTNFQSVSQLSQLPQSQLPQAVSQLLQSQLLQSQLPQSQLPQFVSQLPQPQSNINGKISGPISAYSTKFENSEYNFFGDAHFSMENVCNMCKDFNINSELKEINPVGGENCWDISRLLAKVFTKASEEKKWIDFYIEIPFLTKNDFVPSKSEIRLGVDNFGYISKLYYIFYDCLNKLSCKYDTVRFHYVDVRLKYRKLNLPEMTTEIVNIMKGENRLPYTHQFTSYEIYISMNRVKDCMSILMDKIQRNDRSRDKYIEITDKIFKDFYFSGGQTMTGKKESNNYLLFKLYLTSDNISEDVQNLMNETFSIIQNDAKLALKINDMLIPPTLIVNRKGKTMHKIRAQLEEIPDANFKNVMINYILNSYKEKVNNSSIIDLWRGMMTVYDGFINAKYRSLNDIYGIMKKFNTEFIKLQEIVSFTVTGASLLMDAYTLGRMFRTYKNHTPSFKSIVYAGDAHIQTYVDFFQKILNVNMIEYNPNKNKPMTMETFVNIIRCLNVNLSDFM